MTHDDQREKDVQSLASAILNMGAATYYNGNGPDETVCMLCYSRVFYPEASMSEINHKTSCAYLIAKDLSATR